MEEKNTLEVNRHAQEGPELGFIFKHLPLIERSPVQLFKEHFHHILQWEHPMSQALGGTKGQTVR